MDLWGSCRVGDSERVKFLLSNEHVDFDPNEADNTGGGHLLFLRGGLTTRAVSSCSSRTTEDGSLWGDIVRGCRRGCRTAIQPIQ